MKGLQSYFYNRLRLARVIVTLPWTTHTRDQYTAAVIRPITWLYLYKTMATNNDICGVLTLTLMLQ